MGYSLSVPARNPKLHSLMTEFMESNFRYWWQVIGSKNEAARMIFRDDVSYGRRKNTLGFDYNASGCERMYAYAATRWMALKIGKCRSKFKDDYNKDTWESPIPVPYYYYDVDTHPTPILAAPTENVARSFPCRVVCHACDEMGVPWRCSKSWQYEALSDILDDESVYLAYSAGLKDIGYANMNQLTESEREALLEKREQVIDEVAGSKIEELRGIMHNELKRLDDLWDAV